MLGAVMVGRANQYLVRNQNQLMESMAMAMIQHQLVESLANIIELQQPAHI